jgi:hypothetical protein
MGMQGRRSESFDGGGRVKARNPNAGGGEAEEMRLVKRTEDGR